MATRKKAKSVRAKKKLARPAAGKTRKQATTTRKKAAAGTRKKARVVVKKAAKKGASTKKAKGKAVRKATKRASAGGTRRARTRRERDLDTLTISLVTETADDVLTKIRRGAKPKMSFPLRTLGNVRYDARKGTSRSGRSARRANSRCPPSRRSRRPSR